MSDTIVFNEEFIEALTIVLALARSSMAEQDEEPEAFEEHNSAILLVEGLIA